MTQEEVFEWLSNVSWFVLWAMTICASILIVGFIAGYASEKAADREGRCINSACETVCKDGQRFKRHEGCAK